MAEPQCSVCSSSGFSLDKFRKLPDEQQEDCLDCLFDEWQAEKNKPTDRAVFDFGRMSFRLAVDVVKQ